MQDNKSRTWYVQIIRDILALVVGIIVVALMEIGLILLYTKGGPLFIDYLSHNPLVGLLVLILIVVAPCILIILVCVLLGILALGFWAIVVISGRTIGTIIHTFISGYVGTIVSEYILYSFFFSEYLIQITINPQRSFFLLILVMPIIICIALVRAWFAMGISSKN